MGQVFKIILYTYLSFLFVSCNHKKKESINTIVNDTVSVVIDTSIYKNKILSCSFPDTVKLNKVIEGRLLYDVNNISFDYKLINKRYLHLILTTNKTKELMSYDEIEQDYLLGYMDSLNIGDFKFKAVFEKKGNQTLNIAIRDYMYLMPDKNTPPDKINLRTSDCEFSKKAYVID